MTPEDVGSLDFGCPYCGEQHVALTGYAIEGGGMRFCARAGVIIPPETWATEQAKEAMLFAVDEFATAALNGTGRPDADAWLVLHAAWERWIDRGSPVLKMYARARWAAALKRLRNS